MFSFLSLFVSLIFLVCCISMHNKDYIFYIKQNSVIRMLYFVHIVTHLVLVFKTCA